MKINIIAYKILITLILHECHRQFRLTVIFMSVTYVYKFGYLNEGKTWSRRKNLYLCE